MTSFVMRDTSTSSGLCRCMNSYRIAALALTATLGSTACSSPTDGARAETNGISIAVPEGWRVVKLKGNALCPPPGDKIVVVGKRRDDARFTECDTGSSDNQIWLLEEKAPPALNFGKTQRFGSAEGSTIAHVALYGAGPDYYFSRQQVGLTLSLGTVIDLRTITDSVRAE